MGRKDSINSEALLVDQYRKQIGRHDEKKDKRGPGQKLRNQKEARGKAMPVQDIILLLGAILGLLACAYVIIYIYLAPQPGQ